jgi:hypothetical protein
VMAHGGWSRTTVYRLRTTASRAIVNTTLRAGMCGAEHCGV